MRGVTVLGVPTSAGAHAPGQERAPEAFRRAGLLESLAAASVAVRDLGDLPKVRWAPDRSNPRAQHAGIVAEVAGRVAGIVAAEVTGATGDGVAGSAGGDLPDLLLVLGGDCTIEVGVVSGFTRAGADIGLIYLDAGPDLNVPASVRSGFLDWMGLAHLLGVPGVTRELSELGPGYPLLQPDQVVLAGTIDDELTDFEHAEVERLDLQVIWTPQVADDPMAAAARALRAVGDASHVLLHLDVDVMDFLEFPAADVPTINAGLTLDQCMAFVAGVGADPRLSAVTVCEFNPDHVDERHELVRVFTQRLAAALTSSQAI